MEKYRRIYNKDQNQASSPDELRIKAGDRPVYPYLSYTYRHFSEGNKRIIIRATGNAISKAIQVIELIKRRFGGLHQQNEISSLEVKDVYEPIQQGLDTVIRSKRLTMMQCTLSKDTLDQSHYGYQEPLPEDQVRQYQPRQQRDGPNEYGSGYHEGRPRGGYYGGGRGRRGYDQGGPRYGGGRGYGYGGGRGQGYGRGRGNGYDGERGQNYGRGRGNGYDGERGQNYGRGRGYGGENRNYDNNYDDDNDGYEQSKQGVSSYGGRGNNDYNRNKGENAHQPRGRGFKGGIGGRGLNKQGGEFRGNQGEGRGRGRGRGRGEN